MNADLIFTHGKSWIGGAIRWFSTGAGESPSYANHVAGIVFDPISQKKTVVEALWTVKQTPWQQWQANNPAYQIWRNTKLDAVTRALVSQKAAHYINRAYGWWKLGAHLGDCLISKLTGGNPFLFRRLFCMDEYPICSWVWAYAYAEWGIEFGADPKYVDPDMMHDYAMSTPGWELVQAQAGI